MKISRRRFLTYCTGLTGSLLLGDVFLYEPISYRITKHKVNANRNNSRCIRIVQLSDLHLHDNISNFHKGISHSIIELKPDLIIFTGDSFDSIQDMNYLDGFLNLLPKNVKKYSILGNWEHWSKANQKDISEIYNLHNCKLLVNETEKYIYNNIEINITGLDDSVGGYPSLRHALKGIMPTNNHLLLMHSPAYFDKMNSETANEIIETISNVKNVNINNFKFSFILSGHTHGGQVALFGIPVILPNGCGTYVSGWYEKNNTRMYVSKGIGTSTLPVRFMCKPEIACFDWFLI